MASDIFRAKMNTDIRKLFPITESYAYFDHASMAPMSTKVTGAMNAFLRDVQTSGPLGFYTWMKRIQEIRAAAARLINSSPTQIAFVANTSEGVSAIANGIAWKSGDNVVSCVDEFPANIYPWMNLAKQGVELRLAPSINGKVLTEDILHLINKRTRAVAISSVQYATGQRMDLATIGKYSRKHNVLFFVDAIQGLGALKMDVEAEYIDALTANSHKFLLGPGGCGFLYISEKAMDVVTPSVVGWLSVENPAEAFSPDLKYNLGQPLPLHSGAIRFEAGSQNFAGIFGFGAALDTILEVGTDQVELQVIELTDRLCAGLADRGYDVVSPRNDGEKSAIVCCTHTRHSSAFLREHLIANKVITADRSGRLRIAPHLYNTHDEVDQLLNALPD